MYHGILQRRGIEGKENLNKHVNCGLFKSISTTVYPLDKLVAKDKLLTDTTFSGILFMDTFHLVLI